MPFDNNTIRHENEKLIANVDDTRMSRECMSAFTIQSILLQYRDISDSFDGKHMQRTNKYVV